VALAELLRLGDVKVIDIYSTQGLASGAAPALTSAATLVQSAVKE
jgi:hypothetical protein